MNRIIRAIAVQILVVLALPFSQVANAYAPAFTEQIPIKKLIRDFVSHDWPKVYGAEAALESRQLEAIPALVSLLDSDKKVQLQNTMDLIYPGAKQFYGHGRILDYDVDWISVRAGWPLEELTFQNFGFREGTINEAALLDAVIKRKNEVQLTDAARTAAMRQQRRTEAVSHVKGWWEKAQKSWNRFDAILEALRSNDPVRQHWTLNWIRHGKTKCDGLTLDSFNKDIVPEVQKLAKSTNQSVRDQAKYLLEDKDGWWLKYKTGEAG